MENSTVNEGKTTAIIAYLWIIGWIIAFIMNNDKKNSFAGFHIRQALGLVILLTIINILDWQIGLGMISWILDIGVFVLWILGFIGAIQGEEKKIPLLGDQFQEWFKGIG